MNDATLRADYDSLWNEVLEAYFPQAIELLFPQIFPLIDWKCKYEFLDKEWSTLVDPKKRGKNDINRLVKVWDTEGQEIFLLIHLQFQVRWSKNFGKRLYIHHGRVVINLSKNAISLVIFCDTNPKWCPNSYGYSLGNFKLYFKFPTAKLLDYQNRWAELEAGNNPFAIVVMAHLKMQQTLDKPELRKQSKLSLIRRIYNLDLPEQDIYTLYRFVNAVMVLPQELEEQFTE